MRKLGYIISVGLLFLMVACGVDNQTNTTQEDKDNANSGDSSNDKLTIYTTLYPLQDFAEKIGGEHVEVQSILPAGANPHTFEPTSKTMVNIAESDLFIYNGASLEAYAESISESLKNEDVTILEASDGVELIGHTHKESHGHEEESHEEESHGHEEESHEEESHGHEEESHEGESHGHEEESHEEEGHDHGDKDPHVWLDPTKAIALAENIKAELASLKPEAKDDFEENFKKLEERLKNLDGQYHETIESKPQKKLLVSHAAYGYWEEAYGVEQVAIAGLSSTQEPSQQQLERIIEKSKKYDLEYVIFEQNITPKIAEVIQKEIGAESLRLHNLSVLTEEDIEDNEDYFSLMKQNLNTLEKALSN
ncbi:metal ABC transporter solute-binding protein, Zn/Mn family [Pontibacillus yanchengensis]|uniref:Adhesin n=1 Tax=Pontibacillus yanchengensis Y32 TaxID=1385514 RepID=A0A0A2TBA1_9BACI|nr:zinc ABC transporter substrate-binding protein [Pontibacillus yanchengensis]KGP71703.1 adhesin [Pontibacillus yanchengensis Y32]